MCSWMRAARFLRVALQTCLLRPGATALWHFGTFGAPVSCKRTVSIAATHTRWVRANRDGPWARLTATPLIAHALPGPIVRPCASHASCACAGTARHRPARHIRNAHAAGAAHSAGRVVPDLPRRRRGSRIRGADDLVPAAASAMTARLREPLLAVTAVSFLTDGYTLASGGATDGSVARAPCERFAARRHGATESD